MRVLAIDAGNTRIKWGWAENGRWTGFSWLPTAEAKNLAAALADSPLPARAVISNVAGTQVAEYIRSALARFGSDTVWVRGAAEQCGVRSGYSDPAQLGSDRWAALIGAWQLFRGPCVVVNAGTTLTADALTGDALFLGGIIVPGVELMRDALARNTAQLRLEEGHYTYFPDRTADAIASGALNALAGAVERMLRYMVESGEADALVVLSGGAAATLAPRLNARVEVVDNLVLEGLACIALHTR